MSIKSSNRDTTLFEALLKSISIYETYSFLANCSTNVDFPTRRAPSTRIAVLPFLVSFHFWSLSYNFRLNILSMFSSVSDITRNMLILCCLTSAKYRNIRKYRNLFARNIEKYGNLFAWDIGKYGNLTCHTDSYQKSVKFEANTTFYDQ